MNLYDMMKYILLYANVFFGKCEISNQHLPLSESQESVEAPFFIDPFLTDRLLLHTNCSISPFLLPSQLRLSKFSLSQVPPPDGFSLISGIRSLVLKQPPHSFVHFFANKLSPALNFARYSFCFCISALSFDRSWSSSLNLLIYGSSKLSMDEQNRVLVLIWYWSISCSSFSLSLSAKSVRCFWQSSFQLDSMSSPSSGVVSLVEHVRKIFSSSPIN